MFGFIEIDTADWTTHIVYIIHILEKKLNKFTRTEK